MTFLYFSKTTFFSFSYIDHPLPTPQEDETSSTKTDAYANVSEDGILQRKEVTVIFS